MMYDHFPEYFIHEAINDWAFQILFPEYTVHRARFHPYDYTDKVNSRPMPIGIRALQIGLRPNLSSVRPLLQQTLKLLMDHEMGAKKADNDGILLL